MPPNMRLRPTPLTLLAFFCLALVAGVALHSAVWSRPGDASDSWRRTAQGWERAGNWNTKNKNSRSPHDSSAATARSASMLRLDMHPAALALGQLSAVLAALAFFSGRTSFAGSAWGHFPELVARSYRASFFGC